MQRHLVLSVLPLDIAISQLGKRRRRETCTDRKVGEPVDILVNNRLVARGEVVVVEDKIGVTMTEIIKAEK